MAYDLKIVGGDIVDGTGAERRRGDVGIKDGKVVALGSAPGTADKTIDAGGQVVAPGFVDIHSHYDAQVLWDPIINVAVMLGHTPLRLSVMGEEATERAARPDEIATMKRLAAEAMDAGAVGLRDLGVQGPCRLFRPAGAEPACGLRRDAGDRRCRGQVGPRHHPVQCRSRSALGGVRGAPREVGPAAGLDGAAGGLARAQFSSPAVGQSGRADRPRPAALSAGRLPPHPDRVRLPFAGRVRHLGLVRRRARGARRRCASPSLRRPGLPRPREAPGRRPGSRRCGVHGQGARRRHPPRHLLDLCHRPFEGPLAARAQACRRRQRARQACHRSDARSRAGGSRDAHGRRFSTSSKTRCARSSRTPTS